MLWLFAAYRFGDRYEIWHCLSTINAQPISKLVSRRGVRVRVFSDEVYAFIEEASDQFVK
jgi:hypothetical protein